MDFEEVWEHGRFISVETTTKATDPVSVRYLPEDTGLRIQFSAKSGAVGLGLMHSGYFVYPYAPDATGVNIEFGSENFIGDRARVCFSHNTSRCRQLVDTSVPQWKNTGPFGLESTEFMDFSGIEIRVNDDPVEVVEWRKYPAGWNALRESGGTLTYHHVAAGPFGGDAEGVSRVESTIQIGSAQSSPEHSAEDVLARIGDDFDNKRVPDASSERGEYFRRQKLALRAKSEQHPALAIFDTLISWEAQEQPGLGDLERKIAENEQSRKALLQDKAEERQSQFKTLGREEALGQAVILLSKWTGWLQANADALKAIEAEAKKAQAMAEYRRGLDALGIYTAEEIDAMCQDAESKEPQAATAGTRANTGNKNSKKSKKKPKGKGKKKK